MIRNLKDWENWTIINDDAMEIINPSTPVVPWTPLNPSKIIIPATPIGPSTPITPIVPINPSNPIIPAYPIMPSKHTEPFSPITPSKKISPISPINPSTPISPSIKIKDDASKVINPWLYVSIGSLSLLGIIVVGAGAKLLHSYLTRQESSIQMEDFRNPNERTPLLQPRITHTHQSNQEPSSLLEATHVYLSARHLQEAINSEEIELFNLHEFHNHSNVVNDYYGEEGL